MAAMAEQPATAPMPSSPSLPSSLRVAVLVSPADLHKETNLVQKP